MIKKKISLQFDIKFRLACLTLLFLNSCNSFYKNDYVYSPPQNSEARECILACRRGKEDCDNSANKAYQECLREAESSSMLNYTIDLNSKQTSVTTRDLNNIEKCRVYSKACERGYNECYVNCGGKVEVNNYSTVK